MIDLAVHGDPAACRAAATELDRQRAATSATIAEMGYGLTTGKKHWQGVAGDGFRLYLKGAREGAEELEQKTQRGIDALVAFATELDKVCAEMAQARWEAEAAGLPIAGDEIGHPYPVEWPSLTETRTFTGGLTPPVPDTDPKLEAYRACQDRVTDAREVEDRAHEALRDAAADLAHAPFLEHWARKVGLIPTNSGPVQAASWAGNAALFVGGAVTGWATQVKYGGLHPLFNGARVPATDLIWWRRMGAAFSSKNWRAHPGMEAPYAKWTSAGKVLNRAGGMLAGATAAFDQWGADSDDPTMSENERAARAGAVGVTTGIGAYGGALVGAQAGAAIGSVFPGPGTVIGGAVGGVVGGVIGSSVGQAAGTALIDGIDAGVKKLKFW